MPTVGRNTTRLRDPDEAVYKTVRKIIMAQTVQPQAAEGLGLQHYLGIVRRRHMYFLIPMFLAWSRVGEQAGFCHHATRQAR